MNFHVWLSSRVGKFQIFYDFWGDVGAGGWFPAASGTPAPPLWGGGRMSGRPLEKTHKSPVPHQSAPPLADVRGTGAEATGLKEERGVAARIHVPFREWGKSTLPPPREY